MSDRSAYLASNNKLLEETINDFSQKPFLFASLNEIVKRADFNKGSFYYRFQNKEDLYIALLDWLNAQHLVFYNEAVLSLKKPYRPVALALAAFEALKRLDEVDHRLPMVLERFSQEETAFRESIRKQSVDFVFDRLRRDMTHAGFDWNRSSDRSNALAHLFYGVETWPVTGRNPELLRSLLETILISTPIASKSVDALLPFDSTETIPLKDGLTMVMGSRRSGKSSIALRYALQAANGSKSVWLFDGQTQKVREIHGDTDRLHAVSTVARKGFRRLNRGSERESVWAELLRLRSVKPSVNRLAYALYEVLMRKPDALVVDELTLFAREWEFPPILAALLKFSTTNSTMITTTFVVTELLEKTDRFVFTKSQDEPVVRTRSELFTQHPVRDLLIRFSEQGFERTARVLFDPASLTTFQSQHPDAVILDIGSASTAWAAIYKRETGEELL
jgi:AcrR family transcriptional regulator